MQELKYARWLAFYPFYAINYPLEKLPKNNRQVAAHIRLGKKYMDPILWFLETILRGFTKARLEKEEAAFIQDNIQKHRIALWINVTAMVFIFLGLLHTKTDAIGTVVSSLIAPVMVLGGAWFSVSFGGVPKKLISVAMSTTLWMFAAFVVSFSTMLVAVAFVTSPYLWPVLAFVYLAVLVGCIQYDTADGLKAGLDETMLRHSRAALQYYHKEGIEPEEK
ncbi:MAG: hypothetical protein NUV53_04185 [Patescibacteria group bacterium]|nr:hypothetical protein [Patescibacteria group bacterium]